jgi:hypothetical protein
MHDNLNIEVTSNGDEQIISISWQHNDGASLQHTETVEKGQNRRDRRMHHTQISISLPSRYRHTEWEYAEQYQ